MQSMNRLTVTFQTERWSFFLFSAWDTTAAEKELKIVFLSRVFEGIFILDGLWISFLIVLGVQMNAPLFLCTIFCLSFKLKPQIWPSLCLCLKVKMSHTAHKHLQLTSIFHVAHFWNAGYKHLSAWIPTCKITVCSTHKQSLPFFHPSLGSCSSVLILQLYFGCICVWCWSQQSRQDNFLPL